MGSSDSFIFDLIIQIVFSVIMGLICRAIVKGKGYDDSENHGFAWGFWLRFIGLLVCIFKPSQKKSKKSSYNSYQSGRSNYSGYQSGQSNHNSYQNNNRYSSNSRTVTKQNFGTKLRTLSDSGDARVQSTEQNRRLVSNAKRYNSDKRRSYRNQRSGEVINFDLSWSENLAELLEATEVVYSNAQMNCKNKMESERFHYYINLHYRSFTAADLCHAKLQEILPYEAQIREIVAKVNKGDIIVDKASKDQMISLRNTLGDLCVLLKKRRDSLNDQTKIIRENIKRDCGERGQDWYNNLMERSGK